MPTMTSTPLRKACSCGPMPTPPKTAAAVSGRVDRQVGQILENLRGELARRRQDERARRAARAADQLVEDRQQERGRLAAAGHRAGEQIAPFERGRNRVGLNRRRPAEAEFFEASLERGVKLQGGKRHR